MAQHAAEIHRPAFNHLQAIGVVVNRALLAHAAQLGQLMRVINRSIREQIATTQQAITIAKEST